MVNSTVINQGSNAIAIGNLAGQSNQGNYGSIAIGLSAGQYDQSVRSIAIGPYAGQSNQGYLGTYNAIAIGPSAGQYNQNGNCIAIGQSAGNTNQGLSGYYAIAIGNQAGYSNQGSNTIAIGSLAGYLDQAANSIILNATGSALDNTTPSTFTVKPIRNQVDVSNCSSLFYQVDSGEIVYGANGGTAGIPGGPTNALQYNNGAGGLDGSANLIYDDSITTLSLNGTLNFATVNNSVAIMVNSTVINQGSNAIAIGNLAGQSNQGNYGSIAIGLSAGQYDQSVRSIAIGPYAGQSNQGYLGTYNAIAIGPSAGQYNQNGNCIAIGQSAGNTNQGLSGYYAIAIGNQAGYSNQGSNTIAIGSLAGYLDQAANSIILNATGSALDNTTPSTFTVKPIRNQVDVSNCSSLFYQVDSGEIVYGPNGGTTGYTGETGYTGVTGPTGPAGIPGGPTNSLQYKNNGAGITGSANLIYDSSITTLSLNGTLNFNKANNSIAIMGNSAITGQETSAIAIGQNAGQNGQGVFSISIGTNAGNWYQQPYSVAIGCNAGSLSQYGNSVAIGNGAGQTIQRASAVAIGSGAGQTSQQPNAIAVGINAGQTSQQTDAIAIGNGAGQTNQGANSIILNATGSTLNNTTPSTFTVKPIRNQVDVSNCSSLFYPVASGEIVYGINTAPGGPTQSLQYNNGAGITGSANLSYDTSITTLSLNGTLSTNTISGTSNTAMNIGTQGNGLLGLNSQGGLLSLKSAGTSYLSLGNTGCTIGGNFTNQPWITTLQDAGISKNHQLRFTGTTSGGAAQFFSLFANSATNCQFVISNYLGNTNVYLSGPTETAWASGSDIRLKKDVVPLLSQLDNIMNLNPVSFRFKRQSDTDPAKVGFIAQDIQTIYPDMITSSPMLAGDDTLYLGLSTQDLIPYLVKGMQEQNAIITSLQTQLTSLQAQLTALEIATGHSNN